MRGILIGLATLLLPVPPYAWAADLEPVHPAPQVQSDTVKVPVQAAYERLLAEDDAAQAEVDRWILEAEESGGAETPLQRALLQGRVEKRLAAIRKAYEEFLELHPDHAGARLAFGSFLNDVQEEEQAREQWQKAVELDPQNAPAWNNLGNYYGHNGMVTNAFAAYEKAIELEPEEPLYYQNLATTTYLFRRSASVYYKLDLDKIMEKVMGLYDKALRLDPDNFILATEVAQTYYGIPSPKTGDSSGDAEEARKWHLRAIAAWDYALELARDEAEREGVQIHLARVKISAGLFDEAAGHLDAVTNALYNVTKRNLINTLEQKRLEATKAGGSTAPKTP